MILFLVLFCFENLLAHFNNPYNNDQNDQSLYSVFSARPKHLDPARSYSSDEAIFTGQIYEPPLQYHYLKRPFELEPLTAKMMPKVTYLGKNNEILNQNANADQIKKTVYLITLRNDIYYQPHPALAKDKKTNQYDYHYLNEEDLENIYHLKDFKKQGTRNVTAYDYYYQILRLADSKNHSPIAGIMAKKIIGFKKLQTEIKNWRKTHKNAALDPKQFTLTGVKVLNKYQYEVIIYGKDPQFIYWFAMPFFAPMPWEAEVFYHQEGMKDRNLSLDWYPLGSGAYYLVENNPNREMILEKNPYFHDDFYPTEGDEMDQKQGLLKRASERLPQVNRIVFTLEKESMPMWNKFLQGYYDRSGISSDVFDQAIFFDTQGEVSLTEEIKQKGINLSTSIEPSIFYWGFNMLDPVVGGYGEKQRKLRQAISIVFDIEEFISIFMNGRGVGAQGPIPPGIFGFITGVNPIVYDFKTEKRFALKKAKRLLKEAGFPNGIDEKTNKPLILHLDAVGSGLPDEKAKFQWMRQQFQKLGIELNIRVTQYNRFRDKVRNGQVQIFSWGWNADYPDPENFLMLLYGSNGKVNFQGENAVNYNNPEYNRLYEKMIQMDNGEKRQEIINQMVEILRTDSPWIWGLHPKSFVLSHSWYYPTKPHPMANNTLKYAKIDAKKRAQLQKKWNEPNFLPIIIIFLILFLFTLPVMVSYWRKTHKPPKQLKGDDK